MQFAEGAQTCCQAATIAGYEPLPHCWLLAHRIALPLQQLPEKDHE
ncbi:hypothetical protein [Chitinophaga costaii]|nr:hypothetical protein [Chitinophaga costaii]